MTKFENAWLFATDAKCKNISIGATSYHVPTKTSSGQTYSYALLPLKYYRESAISILVETGGRPLEIYGEYIDEYSDLAVAKKRFLAKYNSSQEDWDIFVDCHVSKRSIAAIASTIIAVCDDIFLDAPSPIDFCERVYQGVKENSFIVYEDSTIQAQAKRAWSLGELIEYGETKSPFVGKKSFVEAKTSEAEIPASEYERFSEGKAFLNYNWDAESEKKITDLSFLDDFVPSQAFYSIARKIEYRANKIIERMNEGLTGRAAIKNDYLNIRLTGNPGSGKTVLGYALSAALHLPIYTVPIQKHTEEDTFEGKNKLVENKLSFVNTDFLKAYKNGGIVVLEEINLADPALIMGAIGQAIEPPFIVNENGFNPVTRHPLCIVIATQNVGTIGSRGINQALVSRFPHTYVINDPTKKEFVDRLLMRNPDPDACEWVYNAYTKIRNWLCDAKQSAEDIALSITARACFGILDDIEEGISPKEALKKIYAIIYGENPEIAEKAMAILNSLPDM